MRHVVRSFLLVATGVAIACGGRVQLTGAGSDSGSGGGSGSGSTSSSGIAGSSSGSGSSSTSSSGIVGSSGSGSGSSSGLDGSSSGSGSSSGVFPDDAGGQYDGTTGKACSTDADCHSPGGPGVNVCTNDGTIFQSGALFPTPFCFLPAKCDPGTDGGIHFCDGPDDPSSPGVCLPTTTPAETGMGICLPQCNFKPDGSAATGCIGKDTCSIYGIGADSSGNPLGIGYCYGGCTSDADCSAAASTTPQHCQVDEGICLTAVTSDLPAGTGCNSASTPAPACNCITNTNTDLGYCASFCATAGSATVASCPSGWVCDASLPTTITNAADASVAGWTSANPGMAGYCAPSCSIATGKTTSGGACPANSTCQAGDVGGPDCLP